MKFKTYQQNQPSFLPYNIDDLIPEDHIVRGIDKIIEELDLSDLYNSYSEEGQPAYHPKMLIKIIIYGYSIGIRSSRKIAERTRSDVNFMYLSGMQRPDFRTISDFRLNKREYLQDCFIQVLQICKLLGLLSLGHISIDGSKIKANASKNKTKDIDGLQRYEEKIKKIITQAEQIDEQEDKKYGKDGNGYELPKDVNTKEKLTEKIKQAKKDLEGSNQKRINLTDKDAKFMKMGNGGKDICYNSQLAVDSDNQIITAYDVKSEGNDNYLFEGIYEEVIKNTATKPKEVSADAGYYSGETYLYIERNNINAYLPDSRFEYESDKEGSEKISDYDRRKFIKDKKKDQYICPEGKHMKFKKKSSRNGVRFRIYKGIDCKECSKSEKCITKMGIEYRQIQIYENDKFKRKMREKLLSLEGRKKYKMRMVIVEPVFAQIKHIMGFNRFLLRGAEKVKAEFSIICTAYNIKKMIKHLDNQIIIPA
jgi:transposase